MSIALIRQQPLERDADGAWSHPGIPNFDEDAKAYKRWLAEQGLEISYKYLESEDGDHPVYVSYFEDENPSFVAWEPTPPEGAGWFTLAIYETEDGPVWVWTRRPSEVQL
jgi:hypothetical protein